MKGQAYILKRIYNERNNLRELTGHQKRLQEIMVKKPNIKDKVKKQKYLSKQTLQNHQKAKKFEDEQQQYETKVSNKALINKLLEINQNNQTKQKVIHENKSKSVGTLNGFKKKQVQEDIKAANLALADRMVKLPPVINMKGLSEESKKQADIGKKILRFHQLKPKKEKQYERMEKPKFQVEDDDLNVNDEKLMNERVQVIINIKELFFKNLLPKTCEDEKYHVEIKTSIRAPRTTEPEMYSDFSKQVINEFVYLKELKQNKKIYIGLYQNKNQEKKGWQLKFLGDFEIDLTPYYLEDCQEDLTFDLRNWKDQLDNPNYMPADMRKKGYIAFQLKVKSKVKEYLLDTMNKEVVQK